LRPTARPNISFKNTTTRTPAQLDDSICASQQDMSRTSTLSITSSPASSPPATKEHFPTFPFHLPHWQSKASKSSSRSVEQPTTSVQLPLVASKPSRSTTTGSLPPPPTRIPTHSCPPTSHGWIQKKAHTTGTMPGGYGRHGDDWLFGGISITQTALGLVSKGKGRKDERS